VRFGTPSEPLRAHLPEGKEKFLGRKSSWEGKVLGKEKFLGRKIFD